MLTLTNNEIPSRLSQLPQPPKKLFIRGELLPLLDRPCVGIVGSRKVSAYGRAVTEKLARELAAQGIVIISGLALGVDSIAHQAALEAGGLTIAVLPSSVNEAYPASHRGLAEQIVSRGGALVSEYPDGTPAFKTNFLERNRLISGLSDALVLTEAAFRSGSLNTARYAMEQGIDVFAVPGNITSVTSEGTNNLIKAGAMPVTAANDILSRLNIKPVNAALPLGDNEEEQAILTQLAAGVSDGNALQQLSGLPIETFGQTLTLLELNGKVRAIGNNNWSL